MYALKWAERLQHCAAGYLRELKRSGTHVGEKAGAMEFVEGVAYWPVYLSALQEIFTLVFHTSKNYEIVVLEKGSWSYYFHHCFVFFLSKAFF